MTAGGRGQPMIGVVDDDVSFREALEGLINAFGFATRAYGSGEAFLQSRSLHEVRCLILDVRLGGMDGLELQARLQREGWSIPIVFVSSQDDPSTRRRALEAGAVGFLGKPFDRDALMTMIELTVDPPPER